MIIENRKARSWIHLAGLFVVVADFGTSVLGHRLAGSIVVVAGSLILLAGGVLAAVNSKDAGRRLPKTVEEQRQIIRGMADEIRAGNRANRP
jgi:hypothetical protein